MATTYTSAAVEAQNPFKTLGVFARTFAIPVTAAMVGTINNVIQALPVFAGETVLSVELVATDLDTGTPALLLSVGDDLATARYIAASDVGKAGGLAKHTVGAPYQYTADNTIDVLVDTAAATGADGTITVTALIQAA